MNTKMPLLLILSIGVAVAMYQGSGAGAVLGYGPSEDLRSGEEINDLSDSHTVNKSFEGQVDPSSDSEIVGVILGALPRFIGLLAVPGLLSIEMHKLGLWLWAAVPLGILANIITYIGAFQAISGRIYE